MEKNKLEQEIVKHRFLYYSGNPKITDFEYDKLEKDLGVIDPDNKLFKEIGFDTSASSFSKINHEVVMSSQGKVYTQEEYYKWFKNKKEQMTVSYKIDGFAITLKYKYNELTNKYFLQYGATRGNGKIGEDITENIKMITDIPSSFYVPKDANLEKEIEIRGEIYMKKSVFKEVAKKAMETDGKKYKTPRNLSAGSARNKNPQITKERKLNFFCYDIIGNLDNNYFAKLSFVENILNIPVVPNTLIQFDESESTYQQIVECRDSLDYDIDGVVYRYNSNVVFDEAGYNSHNPRGACAWKFENENEDTVLIDVDWQVSRTRQINGVGIIEPIELDGAEITRASLHNITILKNLNINIGDVINVSRRGSVIPHIENLVTKNSIGTIEIPTICPECGGETEIMAHEKSGIENLYCTNENCVAVKIAEFEHFCDRMNMKGIAKSTLTKMIKNNFVSEFDDLFYLSVSDIMRLEGFKKKSAEKVYNIIQTNKRKKLSVFLSALGISSLGRTVSELVADKMENILEYSKDILVDELCKIEGIAEKTATDILNGLVEKDELIKNLLENIEIIVDNDDNCSSVLEGKVFCISGSMEHGKKHIAELISKYGGVVKSGVSKSVTHLIAGPGSGSKSEKANEYGIPIYTEENFLSIINLDEVDVVKVPKSTKNENKSDNIEDWLN